MWGADLRMSIENVGHKKNWVVWGGDGLLMVVSGVYLGFNGNRNQRRFIRGRAF